MPKAIAEEHVSIVVAILRLSGSGLDSRSDSELWKANRDSWGSVARRR